MQPSPLPGSVMRVVALCLFLIPLAVGCGDDSDVLVGSWIPTSVSSDALPRGLEPTELPLRLEDNGKWEAEEGCRPVAGVWSVQDERLTIGSDSPHTGEYCVPPTVPYRELLATVTSFDLDGDELVLRDDKGSEVIAFERKR